MRAEREAIVHGPSPVAVQRDGWLIDSFGPDGVSAGVLDITRNVVKIQTGYLYHYAFAMLIGVAGLITWFMFGMGAQ